MANSVDTDQTPRSAASDQDLHSLLTPIPPIAYGKYGTENVFVKTNMPQRN